jgi:hypothetical protein
MKATTARQQGGDGAPSPRSPRKEQPMAKYVHVVLNMPKPKYKILIYAKVVFDALTDNPSFQAPSPVLSLFEAKIQALDKLETDAAHRVPGAASARNAAREQVREHLFHTCGYVQGVAETLSGTVDLLAVRAVVESAGMGLKKVAAHARLAFAAKQGAAAGSVDLTAPASRSRDTHEWEHSENQLDWTRVDGTRQARTTIVGLPVGTPLYFRHRLLTKSGCTEWCEPIVLTLR